MVGAENLPIHFAQRPSARYGRHREIVLLKRPPLGAMQFW
jgi:hypothetical protein